MHRNLNLLDDPSGIGARPRLVQRNPEAVTRFIVRWWLERWVATQKRLERQDALERLAAHTLVHPIRNGARVQLPRTDLDQHVLFEDLD